MADVRGSQLDPYLLQQIKSPGHPGCFPARKTVDVVSHRATTGFRHIEDELPMAWNYNILVIRLRETVDL